MKDKNGHEYNELRAIQTAQLKNWGTRIVPNLFSEVSDYVVRHNTAALDDKSAHRVFRGQDVIQIFMDWPDLKPCYPSPKTAEEVI